MQRLTYVSIPDSATVNIAKQDVAIDAKTVTLDAKLKQDIRDNSEVVKFIKTQVLAKIRLNYSLEDELCLLRLRDANKEEWDKYNAYIDECEAWGEAATQKLGI